MQSLFAKNTIHENKGAAFTSLRASLVQMKNSENEVHPLKNWPMSDQFKSVLNKNGEIQIGNSVYVISEGIVTEYEASVYKSDGLAKTQGKIKQETKILSGSKRCEGTPVNYRINNQLYRMLGLAFNTNYGVYQEAGAKTYWQKGRNRLFGGISWEETSEHLNNVYVSVSGSMTTYHNGLPLGPFVLPGTGSDTDTDGEVTKLGMYSWSDTFGVNMNTNHTASLQSGTRSCSLNYVD